MRAVYRQRGGREYPAGGDGLGRELPDRDIVLKHVQRSLVAGLRREWVGYDAERGRWLVVHESRLTFEEVAV